MSAKWAGNERGQEGVKKKKKKNSCEIDFEIWDQPTSGRKGSIITQMELQYQHNIKAYFVL